MGFVAAIAPLIIVAGIVGYVIERLKRKNNEGTLGKKKSKGAQDLLDSLIPLGMLLGCAIGFILSMFFPISPLTTVSLGGGIGYLFGFFMYEMFSKEGKVSRK